MCVRAHVFLYCRLVVAQVSPTFFSILPQTFAEAGGILVGSDAIIVMRRMRIKSFIIGCSGNDMESSFLAAGADCFWGKPLPPNEEIRKQFLHALKKRG